MLILIGLIILAILLFSFYASNTHMEFDEKTRNDKIRWNEEQRKRGNHP
jgi:hypothetical protein